MVLLATAAGCPEQKDAASSARPFAGQKLRIGVPRGVGFDTAWDAPLKEWSAQTGAEVRLDEVDVEEVSQPLGTALGTDAVTLLLFPITRAGELTASRAMGVIPEVSQSEGNLNWLDLFQGLREGVCSRDKQPAIVPLSCPVLVCYYREDLLKQAGLNPPETWDDYQKLLDTLPQWAPGLAAVEPWREDFRATMFLARAAGFAKHPGFFSFYFDIQTGAPLIDTPGFVRALEVAQVAIAKMPQDVLNYSPADCRRELLEGRAAIAITLETGPGNPLLRFGPIYEKLIIPKIGDKPATTSPKKSTDIRRAESISIGFCRLPGSAEVYNLSRRAWESLPDAGINHVTLTGFAGLAAAVSAKCTPLQAEASWNVLTSLTMGESTVSFPPGTRGPCRESQLSGAGAWVGPELEGAEGQKYLNAVGKCLRDKRVVAEIPVPGHWEFRLALWEGLNAALSGKAAPVAALGSVAEEWKEIAKQQNLANSVSVRDCYRSALGLPRLE